MPVYVDLVGKRFGKWTVIKRYEKKAAHSYWVCRCDCGNEAVVRGSCLLQGKSKSCGCARDVSRIKAITKHGQYGTRLYRIWDNMKSRCYNPNDISYPKYGARGIAVCNEWREFQPFYAWSMTNGYQDNLTIDRIDNSKGYSPGNCRWVDMIMQSNNRRSNKYVTYNGETLTIAQWARKLGINYMLLWKRLKRGWAFKKAISTTSLRKKVA